MNNSPLPDAAQPSIRRCGKQRPQPFGVPGTPLSAWQHSRALAEVRTITLDALLPVSQRASTNLIVVAPHPDDEVLACGGLLAGLAGSPQKVTLVAVTDGEGSHPGSSLWPAERLRAVRRQESINALGSLGYQPEQLSWYYLALPDGQVPAHRKALQSILESIVCPGDCLITTWRDDGHCDHQATGRAAADCAHNIGARLLEMPVWAWHWADPEDSRIPWARARKLMLDDQQLARKRRAIAAHASQLQSDPGIHADAVLSQTTLARLMQPFELLFL